MKKIALCGALLGVIPLAAQDPTEGKAQEIKAQVEKKIAEAATSFSYSFGQMVSGKTVKGSPYSAQAVNESSQTLADGNRISRSTSSMLYRDSEGRERREETIGNIAAGEGSKTVFISDPVDGVQYTLESQSKVARKTTRIAVSGRGGGTARAVYTGPATTSSVTTSTGENTVTITGDGGSVGGGVGGAFLFRTSIVEKDNAKVEHLGTQIMEGVSAEGTRTTTTIPAGQIGNEQPINIVSERWFSPELQVTVMTKHSDPRSGMTTYKLTNISRSEPSPTLFQVPSDYTVKGAGGELFKVRTDRPEEQQ